jgi:allantoate deiminase
MILMRSHSERADIVLERIKQLAAISEEETCITRTYGTAAFIRGRDLVQQWMNDAKLETSVDNIGNLRGIKRSNNPSAKTFVIASHIDTIRNAGMFDGPLGVIAGIDIAQYAGEVPFNLMVIAFADEEGCRFHSTYLGSHAVTGNFDPQLLSTKDHLGIMLEEVILANGGSPKRIPHDALPTNEWMGYYEIHIEQGPVLYDSQQPAAVVTAIAGQSRIQVELTGVSGHAGTVPMHHRNDALVAAADCIIAIERFACELNDGLVATVGKLDISHPASNVIPGNVSFTIDLRSAEDSIRLSAYEAIQKSLQAICESRSIKMQWTLVQQSGAITCDPLLTKYLSQSLLASGLQSNSLVSGAGHDAVAVAAVAPICMLFVRCFQGISHNPLENVEVEDIKQALIISDNFIHGLVSA